MTAASTATSVTSHAPISTLPQTLRTRPVGGLSSTHGPHFATARGLRRILVAILIAGPEGWSTHPDVPALVRFCEAKYALLARRYGQTPHDAVVAAFEVLRLPSTLDADDPWGVVTRAVQRTLQAADRADRLLCSVDHARRLMSSGDRDVERFSDLTPDGTVPVVVERFAPPAAAAGEESAGPARPPSDTVSVRETITHRDVRIGLITVRTVLSAAGWPPDDARVALEYVCHGLREAGNPGSAFDALRRDLTPLRLLDVDHRNWTRLCHTLLGDPGRPGMLHRATCGARPLDLLADTRLMADLVLTAPGPAVRHG